MMYDTPMYAVISAALFEFALIFKTMRASYFSLLLCIVLASCVSDSAPKTMPDSFSVELSYYSGSVPPPDHFEYVVKISARGDSSVTMWPGYRGGDADNPPEWNEPLDIKTNDAEALYGFLTERSLLAEDWKLTKDSLLPMGSACESMAVSVGQIQVTMLCDYNPKKPDMIKQREEFASKVRAMIRLRSGKD